MVCIWHHLVKLPPRQLYVEIILHNTLRFRALQVHQLAKSPCLFFNHEYQSTILRKTSSVSSVHFDVSSAAESRGPCLAQYVVPLHLELHPIHVVPYLMVSSAPSLHRCRDRAAASQHVTLRIHVTCMAPIRPSPRHIFSFDCRVGVMRCK
jgi:hypothetical protein